MALSYQWYKGGSPITGATSATYTKTAESGDAGDYYCKASNQFGSTNSNTAVVTVLEIPQDGLLVSYKADVGVTEIGGYVTSWAKAAGSLSGDLTCSNVVFDTATAVNGYHPLLLTNAQARVTTSDLPDDVGDHSFSLLVKQGSGSSNSRYAGLVTLCIDQYHSVRYLHPNLGGNDKWSLGDYYAASVNSDVTSETSDSNVVQLLTVIVTGGVPALYIGTTQVTSATLSGWALAEKDQGIGIQLGHASSYGEYISNARIFEFHVWDRALTQSDVDDLLSYVNRKYDLELE